MDGRVNKTEVTIINGDKHIVEHGGPIIVDRDENGAATNLIFMKAPFAENAPDPEIDTFFLSGIWVKFNPFKEEPVAKPTGLKIVGLNKDN